MSEIHPLTDEECSLWFCEQCRESGALYVSPGAGVYGVVQELADEHRRKSPSCEAVIGKLRIARPNSWYRDTVAGQ